MTTLDFWYGNSLLIDSDDDFKVWSKNDDNDNPIYPSDDNADDRTHQANIDGGVYVRLLDSENTSELCAAKIPICDITDGTEERRVLKIRARVYWNPQLGEPYSFIGNSKQEAIEVVKKQIARANLSWAQACIKVELNKKADGTDDIIFEYPPKDEMGDYITDEKLILGVANMQIAMNKIIENKTDAEILEVIFANK